MSSLRTGRMVIGLAGLLAAVLAGSGYAEDKPNAVERGAKKAGRAIDHAAQRTQAGIERTADRTGKWAQRTGKRAANATERTVDKTENWVRKKTE